MLSTTACDGLEEQLVATPLFPGMLQLVTVERVVSATVDRRNTETSTLVVKSLVAFPYADNPVMVAAPRLESTGSIGQRIVQALVELLWIEFASRVSAPPLV